MASRCLHRSSVGWARCEFSARGGLVGNGAVRTYTEVVTSSAVRIASLVTSRDSWGIAWWSGNDALW